MQRLWAIAGMVLCAAGVGMLAGCGKSDQPTVVLYTSVDEPYARPIVDQFQRETGIHVELKTDVEATKTAGLAERIIAERDNPQADVYWGNEVFHTIELADAGALAPYESPRAADIPGTFKDRQHRWAGVGLRARVLAVANGSPLIPQSIEDLAKPALKDKIALARPTAGTTGGWVGALYVLWGSDKARAYFEALHGNGVHLVGGNSVVADDVGQQIFYCGVTDNDDVQAAQHEGGKLQMVLPDQASLGTLTMPTTVALVAGAKHADAARKLVDFLLSEQTERMLIERGFARWSVRGGAEGIKSMDVDYAKVAAVMPQAVREATAILEGR